MCSFCARKQSRRRRLSRWSRFSEFYIDMLVVQELDYLTSNGQIGVERSALALQSSQARSGVAACAQSQLLLQTRTERTESIGRMSGW